MKQIDVIWKIVSDYYKVDEVARHFKTAKGDVKLARQIDIVIALNLKINTLQEVGAYFNRDYSTLDNTKRVISEFCDINVSFRKTFKYLTTECLNNLSLTYEPVVLHETIFSPKSSPMLGFL
jgi:chromosomal replication initiation ATPase DnaA